MPSFYSVVQALVGDVAESLTRQRYTLEGERSPHTFAVGVANSVPYLAAQAVSLERGSALNSPPRSMQSPGQFLTLARNMLPYLLAY
jgi:hypothetical protein